MELAKKYWNLLRNILLNIFFNMYRNIFNININITPKIYWKFIQYVKFLFNTLFNNCLFNKSKVCVKGLKLIVDPLRIRHSLGVLKSSQPFSWNFEWKETSQKYPVPNTLTKWACWKQTANTKNYLTVNSFITVNGRKPPSMSFESLHPQVSKTVCSFEIRQF